MKLIHKNFESWKPNLEEIPNLDKLNYILSFIFLEQIEYMELLLKFNTMPKRMQLFIFISHNTHESRRKKVSIHMQIKYIGYLPALLHTTKMIASPSHKRTMMKPYYARWKHKFAPHFFTHGPTNHQLKSSS